MARKNIFDILSSEWDFLEEIRKINYLLTEVDCCYYKERQQYTIEECVDSFCFHYWKQRNRCLNCEEIKSKLGINDVLNYNILEITDIIIYIEYALNIIQLLKHKDLEDDDFEFTSDYDIVQQNIHEILEQLNYKALYYADEEKVLVVEKSPQVTAAAEIVDDNLSHKIIEYNHHTMKGDLLGKKNILLAFADMLEPKRKILNGYNKSFTEDLFLLFNKINLRHNNKELGKYYIDYVAKMTDEQIEDWYDEIYQMALLAILLSDQMERNVKISELKLHF